MKLDHHHIVPNKLDYAKGKRPQVDCILCAVHQDDPQVANLTLFQGDQVFITLNLYPYTAGHLMVVPSRHVEDIRELTQEEAMAMFQHQNLALSVLDKEYGPAGYNLGYNMGKASGASIAHLHLQIVPRFGAEVGFFDVLSDSRVIVEDPHVTRDRLQRAFAEATSQMER